MELPRWSCSFRNRRSGQHASFQKDQELGPNKEEENRNFHLYIHQPGMFYLQEFGLKFPSEIFGLRLKDDSNDNAKIQILSYDISMDPHLACSTKNYHECINKQIISTFNDTIGCTYPIQR